MRYADIAPLYADSPVAERVYARIRFATAPLVALAALVPRGVSAAAELGCSAGVFANVLKTLRPALEVTGVDADAQKVAAAARTLKERAGISFRRGDAFDFLHTEGPFGAIIIVDLLYLLEPARQDRLIALAAAKLSPGGTLLVKEMNDRPAWKRRWCAFQEWLAVRITGLTAGDGIYLRPAAAYESAMRAAGLTTETFELGRGYLHPHYALRGTKV
jgi:2-polyprenyl-3-methyl-5-hydroxy-6-metoxy-1,4-benzoquinol methylase